MDTQKLMQFQQIMEMEQKPPMYKWVFDPLPYDYVCSCCGEHSEYKTKYCPNCGAKMIID